MRLQPRYTLGTLVLVGGDGSELPIEFRAGFKGDPGPSGAPAHEHVQNVPEAVWTIDHNLGHRPLVIVYDTAGTRVFGEVANPTSNQTVLTFSAPFAGTARLA